MICLNIPTEPYWLDLPYGLRVRVRPLDTAVHAAARAAATAEIRKLVEDIESRRQIGAALDGLPDLDDPAVRDGYAHLLYAQCLGRHAILEWEGVRTADGSAAAPVTPRTVNDLMRIDQVQRPFVERYTAPVEALLAEGEGSGAAPNGTSVTAPNTAPGAAPPAPLAPTEESAPTETAAPTSSTAPEARTDGAPGNC